MAGPYTGHGRKSEAEGKAAARAAGRERAAEAIKQLDAAIDELAQSDERWAEYLRLTAAMHDYSARNRILILVDSMRRGRPVPAMCAGFHRWRQLGRPVLKGSKGIGILAPMTAKREDEETGETVVFTRGFRVISVFAVEDTDGPPIGRPVPIASDDDGPEAGAVWTRLLATCEQLGVAVSVVDAFADGARGCYVPADGRIEVVGSAPAAMRAKTLAHELAHALDHRAGGLNDRRDAEVIAESVAFVVCAQYGIDTSAYSAPYVAAWGGDVKRFRAAADRVGVLSAAILALSCCAGSCGACGWTGEGEGGCVRCR